MSDTSQGPGWWQASDGKWYPPAAVSGAPPVGAIPAPETTKGRGLKIGLIVGLIVAALLIAGAIAVVVATTVADDAERAASAQDDVEVLACEVTNGGFMDAQLRITNNSSKRSTYIAFVIFEAPDGSEIETSLAMVKLDPGESIKTSAPTLTDAPAKFDCRVDRVSSSGGG